MNKLNFRSNTFSFLLLSGAVLVDENIFCQRDGQAHIQPFHSVQRIQLHNVPEQKVNVRILARTKCPKSCKVV
jgi:hypothetical protein